MHSYILHSVHVIVSQLLMFIQQKALADVETTIRSLEEQLEAKRHLEVELKQRISVLETERNGLAETIQRMRGDMSGAMGWQAKYQQVAEEIPRLRQKHRY